MTCSTASRPPSGTGSVQGRSRSVGPLSGSLSTVLDRGDDEGDRRQGQHNRRSTEEVGRGRQPLGSLPLRPKAQFDQQNVEGLLRTPDDMGPADLAKDSPHAVQVIGRRLIESVRVQLPHVTMMLSPPRFLAQRRAFELVHEEHQEARCGPLVGAS